MQLTSTDFLSGSTIPKKFTCDGEDVSPALEIRGVLNEAKSLALVLDDPDAPSGTFTHWVVWNIPVGTEKILSGSLPVGAKEGLNSAGRVGYVGPCPPAGTHNYIFTLYALDISIDGLDPAISGRDALLGKIGGHILTQTELLGLYCRDGSK